MTTSDFNEYAFQTTSGTTYRVTAPATGGASVERFNIDDTALALGDIDSRTASGFVATVVCAVDTPVGLRAAFALPNGECLVTSAVHPADDGPLRDNAHMVTADQFDRICLAQQRVCRAVAGKPVTV